MSGIDSGNTDTHGFFIDPRQRSEEGIGIVRPPSMLGGFWYVLKNFLNVELIGVEMRRKDIINSLNVRPGRLTTLDCYLNYLHKAGYLYKPKRGWYGIAITIPFNLSVDDCRSEAYGVIDSDGHRRVIIPVEPNKNRRMSIHKEKEFFEEEEFAV